MPEKTPTLSSITENAASARSRSSWISAADARPLRAAVSQSSAICATSARNASVVLSRRASRAGPAPDSTAYLRVLAISWSIVFGSN